MYFKIASAYKEFILVLYIELTILISILKERKKGIFI